MNSSWRDNAIVRMAGSAASWFLFSLSFTLLFQVSLAVMTLGGSCASGGPYEIAVECPDNVAAFAPLSIFGGLIAVAIGALLSQGFGTPLTTWAWPVLFIGLGIAFLLPFIYGQDVTGLIIGVVFIIMGAVPLLLEIRGSVQRIFIGTRDAAGNRFYEGPRARRSLMTPGEPNPEGSVPPNFGNWALAIGITAVAIVLGYTLGVAAF